MSLIQNPSVRAKVKGQRQMPSGPAHRGPRPREGQTKEHRGSVVGGLYCNEDFREELLS